MRIFEIIIQENEEPVGNLAGEIFNPRNPQTFPQPRNVRVPRNDATPRNPAISPTSGVILRKDPMIQAPLDPMFEWRMDEMHHAYDNPDHNTPYGPIRRGDTLRVFHGFRSFDDAYRTAVYGLSGKEPADRAYSYEFDNNPTGLFVTLDFKIATEFAGQYTQFVIVEFNASVEDLEPPVWPGGGYTVQGQMAQYFGRGAPGRIKRNERKKAAELETQDILQGRSDKEYVQHIHDSDSKHLAFLLTQTREKQALFIGDLNPQDIVAFHVRPTESRINDPWTRISREQFLQQHTGYNAERKNDASPKQDKMFLPAEDFNGDKFLSAIRQRYGARIDQTLARLWSDVVQAPPPQKTATFIKYFGNFLWPRQYRAAIFWFRSYFRNLSDPNNPV